MKTFIGIFLIVACVLGLSTAALYLESQNSKARAEALTTTPTSDLLAYAENAEPSSTSNEAPIVIARPAEPTTSPAVEKLDEYNGINKQPITENTKTTATDTTNPTPGDGPPPTNTEEKKPPVTTQKNPCLEFKDFLSESDKKKLAAGKITGCFQVDETSEIPEVKRYFDAKKVPDLEAKIKKLTKEVEGLTIAKNTAIAEKNTAIAEKKATAETLEKTKEAAERAKVVSEKQITEKSKEIERLKNELSNLKNKPSEKPPCQRQRFATGLNQAGVMTTYVIFEFVPCDQTPTPTSPLPFPPK